MNRLSYIYNKVSSGQFLYVYAVVALLLPNIALCYTECLAPWACGVNVLLPLSLYMLFFSVAKRPGKMIWWAFIFVFFAAFQLVLLYLFGTGVIAVDMFLNLVTTNPGEAMELLDNLAPAVVGVFVVYLPLLILGGVNIRRDSRLSVSFQQRVRHWAMQIGAIGLFCLLASYLVVDGYRMRNQLYPVNVCYNLYLAFERNAASDNYREASRDFKFDARSEHSATAPEVYVMVVGETARAHNFSLYGYPRNTNPLLFKTPGIKAFPNVTTQSNTTHKSVPMLLSAASAEDFERLFHEKGILAAFKEAGFHTVFISNQLPNHSFIDFLGEQADEHYFLKKEDASQGNHYDEDLLQKLDEILPLADASSSAHYHYRYRKLFVVLHSYGSHFNYQERYPRSFAYFKPDSKSEAKPENRRDLLNAYDNTIRYTDYILHGIVERLQKWEGVQTKTDGVYDQPTSAMLYTSDHGENIFDDERSLFLHAAPKASDYELHVPFIIWTSAGFSKQYPDILKALGENRSKQVQSSLSAFHTMLGIGGIQTRYRLDEYSVASGKYHPTKLLYLDDHDEAIPQEDAKF
ncbi:phosphoethanolamine transferase [Segatella copri]|uniref:Lipid A phosphoethanolamine transferase n=1 Tax=Segatella copri TaxID=165179 RepID=A0AAW4N635_9BACT|nr:phosphoethanolamine transferase [Segatella copri]MBV3387700.1 lipid A phosphoethanolamine transferase [Segatella copri]MBV3395339.1 lipid A phosphoethanolamine transferase [Segatella copri]MBV3404878.1 lipid A phosphoethanolamine transferase [Segatella copri]